MFDKLEDFQLRLLAGSEIYFDNIPIYSVPLIDIINFGYTKYNQIISLLCMDNETAKLYFKNNTKITSTFYLISSLVLNEIKMKERGEFINTVDSIYDLTLHFLSLIFRNEVTFDTVNCEFIIGDNKVLSLNNYDNFRTILKTRNCIDDIEEDSENPDNEKTRQLLKKRKIARQKILQLKSKKNDENDENLNLADLISIFAEAEHIPPSDVFKKYDIYQFNDQFNRMKIFKDYNVNIQAILAGAKNENISLQHWLSKIKRNNN